MKRSLLLPLLMNVLFADSLVYGARLISETRIEMFATRDEVELDTAPEVRVLVVLLWLFSAFMTTVALAILYLWICQ